MKLSVVSPVYRAEGVIAELVDRIRAVPLPPDIELEIVLVEDGSPDGSWHAIEGICAGDTRVKGIKLSRNFGQHNAITAGIACSTGDQVAVIDCDLQDDPVHLIEMVAVARAGHDIVYTQRRVRRHSFLKNVTAVVYTAFFNSLTDHALTRTDVGSFSLMTRKVADAYGRVKDARRHYLMVLRELGFKSTYVTVEHHDRRHGKSSYTLGKLVRHAIDGITFHSTRLLRFSVSLGFILCLLAFAWAVRLVYLYLTGHPPEGYTSLMVMLLLSTGIVLISIGIMGIYVGNIFLQVKDRPLFIIDHRLNDGR
jgi:polyisoprenyl-phosphate glycosyltransferase